MGLTTDRSDRCVSARNPLLLVDGNCQAQHIGAMLRAAKAGELVYAGRDYGFMPSYAGKGCRIIPPRDAAAAVAGARREGRRVIQISQQTPLGRGEGIGPVEGIDRRVVYPELRMWALSRRRFVQSFKADFNLERILELDLSSAEAAEKKTGFPVSVASFFRDNVRKEPLFHTVNHPTGSIFSLLLRGIAVVLRDEIDSGAVNAIADDVASREGLNYHTDHPLSAEDRAELQFEWGPSYELYSTMLHLRETGSWDDLRGLDSRLHASFSEDTQFWRTRLEMGRALGDDGMAIEAFEQLLDRCPGMPGVWVSYANLLATRKELGPLGELAARAEIFYEGAFAFDVFAARVFLKLGNIERAEAHARACYENSPDELQSAFPLLQVLIRKRDGAALKALVADLRACPKIFDWQINAFLAKQKVPWVEDVLGPIPAERNVPRRALPRDV